MDASDPQKATLYAWEETWGPWNYNSLTLTECRAYIEHACRLYDVEVPRVRQHRSKEFSWCHILLGIISMQGGAHRARGGRNPSQCLHEAAHWIVYKKFGDTPCDHGPTFLGVYMWLMIEARLAPPSALTASARAAGLKWRQLSPEQCSAS